MAAALTACALALGACGGGERQDANEPEGTFNLEVANASFPAQQSIAKRSTLRLDVRNTDSKAIPNVAVTIETKAKDAAGAPEAFAQDVADPSLADPSRPIWILDRGPDGGETAYTNTWALGRLEPGQSRTFEWKVTAVKPGSYDLDYAVFPGLNGRAKPASGAGTGSFHVEIDDEPPAARVNGKGKVVRGTTSD